MKGIIDIYSQDFIKDDSGPKITIEDLENALREVWASIPKRKTVMVYPDGYYEAGEADTDDVPLAVGNVVQWSLLRSSLFTLNELPDGRKPYKLGVVKNIEPWDEDLSDRVYVQFNTGGGWMERNELKKSDSWSTPEPSLPAPDDSSH